MPNITIFPTIPYTTKVSRVSAANLVQEQWRLVKILEQAAGGGKMAVKRSAGCIVNSIKSISVSEIRLVIVN